MSRWRAKKQGHIDANHNKLKRVAERFYSVFDTSGSAYCVDLIISGGNAKTIAIEIKTEEKNASFTLGQIYTMALWKGYVAFVSNENEMLAVMNHPDKHCLSRQQKDKLLTFVEQRKLKTKVKDYKKVKVH